jgi:DMSO/TMAO reductase YedYZ molybdopterin-dependent catalytic subunit
MADTACPYGCGQHPLPVARSGAHRQADPDYQRAQARYVVFHAFDDKAITEDEGRHGVFYGTIPLFLVRRPQTILALEMNGEPLPVVHGAPVRLRVESQLGFKMVKWIRSIELVSDYRHLGQGQGGWREDQQYYTTWAGI